MRAAMAAWPEIVFIDGTYSIFNLGYILILLQVQNSMGRSEIVGVAIIPTEKQNVLEWVAQTFKEENSTAIPRMECLMTDKDLTERNAFREAFPDVTLYLYIFHTLRSLNRKMVNLKLGEKKYYYNTQTTRWKVPTNM